jgi:hypothetical protein
LKNTLSQKDALLSHLKAQIKKVENEIIDIPFEKRDLEVNDGLQLSQDMFFESLESIQKIYSIINYSLQIIVDKEKQLVNTRSKFQELMMWNQNINIPRITQFIELEQLKSDMETKTWENNQEERKRLTRQKKPCLNSLLVLDVEMEEIDIGDIHSMIGTLNVNEKREEKRIKLTFNK